jgi:hypothetical protein
MCDDHPERAAYKRVQGETDSFGAEFHDMCKECYEKHRIDMEEYRAQAAIGKCEWCGSHATDLRKRRNMDEGLSGRIYDVCGTCVQREMEWLEEELENSGYYDGWI